MVILKDKFSSIHTCFAAENSYKQTVLHASVVVIFTDNNRLV